MLRHDASRCSYSAHDVAVAWRTQHTVMMVVFLHNGGICTERLDIGGKTTKSEWGMDVGSLHS